MARTFIVYVSQPEKSTSITRASFWILLSFGGSDFGVILLPVEDFSSFFSLFTPAFSRSSSSFSWIFFSYFKLGGTCFSRFSRWKTYSQDWCANANKSLPPQRRRLHTIHSYLMASYLNTSRLRSQAFETDKLGNFNPISHLRIWTILPYSQSQGSRASHH